LKKKNRSNYAILKTTFKVLYINILKNISKQICFTTVTTDKKAEVKGSWMGAPDAD